MTVCLNGPPGAGFWVFLRSLLFPPGLAVPFFPPGGGYLPSRPGIPSGARPFRGWPLTAWPGWDEGYPPPETNTVRPHPASSRRHAKTTKAPARAGRFRQPFMIPPKIWFHPYAIRRTGNKKPAKKQGSQPKKGRRQGVSVPHRRFKATAWRKARQARFA